MQIKAVSRTATISEIDLYVYTFVIHESNYRREWHRGWGVFQVAWLMEEIFGDHIERWFRTGKGLNIVS